ncbi:MAG: 6-hydroxycyclohex-1-ene-1-carbonyl-CoA dehydrogenase [candidate division Zixibacteria bacterium]|nr:6-hydroxycyclohex-1-ene-1-carbonyl-CoA dehydrogenase [candidate division Zixibacteria bacterium]MBU1470047.1 6-hydroxycyclohex-1-ene-1-carbonyl-CoA dehydrogenase [candidate division Zixibacteria bacterium]MBU2624367.1 6-hydroxycyclohex-1-ene-1-carbonyl-CoA dehydrogenase [candidate division Zixibacteria bacterium]
MEEIRAYQMTAKDKPFEQVTFPVPEIGEGEALVEVAGCGVCHTDLSFWHYGVPTRHELPLVLGHEISGTVLKGPSEFKGKPVIIPAVLPCGECELCKKGQSNICQNQKMPGNDFNGGFASHVVVPARYLTLVPDAALETHSLAELSVIADAVSTPYQVIVKSDLQEGDFAIVIGVGGIGIYAAQLAKILGARVLAIDIAQDKLDQLAEVGVSTGLNSKGLDIKEIKKKVKDACKELGASPFGWKIFEMSGTKAGQELAFALLGIAGTLSIVGFTLDKLEVRLSNLMAFDAKLIGTWGCKPELYTDVINLTTEGKLKLKPFTDTFGLSQINDIFQQTLEHKLLKRSVLIPDF